MMITIAYILIAYLAVWCWSLRRALTDLCDHYATHIHETPAGLAENHQFDREVRCGRRDPLF